MPTTKPPAELPPPTGPVTCPYCKRRVEPDEIEYVWQEAMCPDCAEVAQGAIASVVKKLKGKSDD